LVQLVDDVCQSSDYLLVGLISQKFVTLDGNSYADLAAKAAGAAVITEI
jgi:hypothetical protein